MELKGSYDDAKNNIILCIWCNAMCLRGLRLKKHIIFHISLCLAFLKHVDFYKAHHSEKRGVLWLASYPVCCDWPNTSSVWRKCCVPYHIWKHRASPWHSYAFFLCVNIWAVLCKSSNTVTYICGGVFKWGVLERCGRVLTFIKNISLGLTFFNLCNFTDLIYARTACNTPKTMENLKSHHVTPLNVPDYLTAFQWKQRFAVWIKKRKKRNYILHLIISEWPNHIGSTHYNVTL